MVRQLVNIRLRNVQVIEVEVLLAMEHFLYAVTNFVEHPLRLFLLEEVLKLLVQIQGEALIDLHRTLHVYVRQRYLAPGLEVLRQRQVTYSLAGSDGGIRHGPASG